ncbi:hypothetical protein OAV62_01670, partial [bacterium]|nr:hypothetical protein [bacterium]
YTFDGTDWTLNGSELDLGASTQFPSVTALSSDTIVYTDFTSAALQAYQFNGSIWATLGSSITFTGSAQRNVVAALSSTNVALLTDDRLYLYRFFGSVWTLISTLFLTPNTPGNSKSMTAMDEYTVCITGEDIDELALYKIDPETLTWTATGTDFALTGYSDDVAVAKMSSTTGDLAFIDADNDLLTLYRWAGTPVEVSNTLVVGHSQSAYIYSDSGIILDAPFVSLPVSTVSTSVDEFQVNNITTRIQVDTTSGNLDVWLPDPTNIANYHKTITVEKTTNVNILTVYSIAGASTIRDTTPTSGVGTTVLSADATYQSLAIFYGNGYYWTNTVSQLNGTP